MEQKLSAFSDNQNITVFENFPHLSIVADKLQNSKMVALMRSGKYYLDAVPNSVSEAVEGCQISSLKRIDEKASLVLISILIDTVNKNLNGELNIEMLARAITGKYWYMTIEEIAYIFNRGIMGEYGLVYGKPSLHTILSWIHQYDIKERLSHCDTEGSKHKERNPNIYRELELRDAKDIVKIQKKEYQFIIGKNRAKKQVEAEKRQNKRE